MDLEFSDLSPAEVLYGLYYFALIHAGKVINITIGDASKFLADNAARNREVGRLEYIVLSFYGMYINVEINPQKPLDVTSYDSYYGEGKAAEALLFMRKMKGRG